MDIKDLVAMGAISPGWRKGSLSWRSGAETVATLEYGSSTYSQGEGTLWLWYVIDGKSMHYTISLVSTVPHYGGRRWWFICPIKKTRVAKLYLPPGATTFASRQAYSLTYRSCQRPFRFERLRRRTERLARQTAQNETKFRALLKRANQPKLAAHEKGSRQCQNTKTPSQSVGTLSMKKRTFLDSIWAVGDDFAIHLDRSGWQITLKSAGKPKVSDEGDLWPMNQKTTATPLWATDMYARSQREGKIAYSPCPNAAEEIFGWFWIDDLWVIGGPKS